MLIDCNPQAVLSVIGLLWSTASPWSTEAEAAVLSCAAQLWVATEPVNQGNEAENFDAAVKTTVEKAHYSGRTEVPGAGNIPQEGTVASSGLRRTDRSH